MLYVVSLPALAEGSHRAELKPNVVVCWEVSQIGKHMSKLEGFPPTKNLWAKNWFSVSNDIALGCLKSQYVVNWHIF